MRIYETTFIINPQSDDATIEKHVGDIKDIITSKNGKIINENHMGTRRLAYDINKLTQGYYATFLYEAETDVLPLLEHHFKVNEAYIRDLTVRIECDPQDYLKQQDPFGKHGSDRREGSSGYQKPGSGSDAPKTEKKVPSDEAKADEAPAEETKTTEAPAEEVKATETPVEETKPVDAPADDKPSEDEL